MKRIKTFEAFVNEASLPFSIEKELRLNGISFELDDDRSEEDDDNRLDYAQIYTGKDDRSGNEWVIKTGVGGGFFYLEISKDDKVEWAKKYPKSQKAYFDQDCMNSLGFLPELD